MGRVVRVVGGVSIVSAPLVLGIGDQLRMAAEGTADLAGGFSEWGDVQAVQQMTSIAAHHGTWVAHGYLTYLAALLAIPALLALWWLAVDRSARWAWTGAVMAMLGALSMMGFAALIAVKGVLVTEWDAATTARLELAMESDGLSLALFLPHLFAFLCVVPQAVALRRARVIPLWACLSLVGSVAVMMVLGSSLWTSALWTVLLVAGFLPAALAILSGESRTASVGVKTVPAAA